MTRWQIIEQMEKKTRKALKKCPVNLYYIKCGFKPPVVNGTGQCSGCRNPDDNEMEWQCCTCCYNEYYIGEAGA